MQATANARGRRITGQLLTGRAVEKRRSSNSDARPSTCISSKVAPSNSFIAGISTKELGIKHERMWSYISQEAEYGTDMSRFLFGR
jgi:hypothetical protein